MRIILASLILALPAAAQDTHTWGSPFYPSTITLEPTTVQGAVAQVVFDNKTVHRDEEVTFPLTMGDLTVTVTALVGRGLTPDRMSVEPPVGYIADPPVIDVAEDEMGRIVIREYLGF